ncbi:MAG: hypothetical protein IT548_16545 [Alphaproteobacteria bacterium]|nr:hypothetical protein [Alphaproteobacteria bacterium]
MIDLPLAMTDAEAAAFTRHLSLAGGYLEYGCGGSTLRAVQQCRGLMRSVDTDIGWIRKLHEHPEVAQAVASGRLAFHHIDVGATAAWGAPAGTEKIRNWPLYAIAPFLKDDIAFDLILVDGRFRLAALLTCALLARDDVTVLCHDYARRHGYSVAEKYFDTHETIDTLAVFRKRANVNRRALHLDLMQTLFDFG